MAVYASDSFSNSSLLSSLGSGVWEIKDTIVTDDLLNSLAGRGDLVIRAVDAPLSKVSADVLRVFLETHGSNLERFNLQNNQEVDGKTLIGLVEMMPHLKTLSFQYLHNVKDEDLLRVVETCNELETLRICQNRRISKGAFYQILNLDRSFLKLSIDLSGKTSGEELEVKAKVSSLRVSGLTFDNRDMNLIRRVKGLKDVEVVLTRASSDAIASLSKERKFAVTVKDVSSKKLDGLEESLCRERISYKRDGNTVRVLQGASEGM